MKLRCKYVESDLVDSIEKELTNELFDDIRTMNKEFNYTPTVYIRMISQYGAIKSVKQLIIKDDNTTSFTKLWQYHRLDLTCEAKVINHKYSQLFAIDEVSKCREKLKNLVMILRGSKGLLSLVFISKNIYFNH